MKTRNDMIAEAKKFFKEHPEKLQMKYILFDLGITHIQKEVYRLAAIGVPYEKLKEYSDRRVKELKMALGIE